MAARIQSLPGPLPTIFYFLVSLFPLVIAHEVGHFIVAKLCRVRVDEFGIGFPPRIARLGKVAETEYTLNLLPLGGFVRLTGEEDPTVPDAFTNRRKSVRSAVLLAGPAANFGLAALIFASMAWFGLIPEPIYNLDGARVTTVSAGSPAASAGIDANDVILSVDGQPLVSGDLPQPGSDRAQKAVTTLVDRTDASGGKPMHVTLLRAGLTLLAAETDLSAVRFDKATLTGIRGREVTSAPAGAPLAAGDIVLDGTTSGAAGGAQLAVLHAAKVLTVVVTPKSARAGEPARMGVQISAPSIPTRYGLLAGAAHGVQFTGSILHAMVEALARMFVGRAEVQLAGPVGISIMSRQMGEQGLVPLLEFMALLSLNLGLINLLPIPALDGGRLLFIAAEAVRGKRVEPSREAQVHLIGFVAVIALMGVITLVEVARLSGITGP